MIDEKVKNLFTVQTLLMNAEKFDGVWSWKGEGGGVSIFENWKRKTNCQVLIRFLWERKIRVGRELNTHKKPPDRAEKGLQICHYNTKL